MKLLNWIFVRVVPGRLEAAYTWLFLIAVIAIFGDADDWPLACFDAAMAILNFYSFYIQQSRSICTGE